MLGRVVRNAAKALRLIGAGRVQELTYELRNKAKGVDLEHVSLDDLGLPPDRAHFHSSSGGPTLTGVFKSVGVPPGSVAIDLGSGKGGAVLSLSELAFAEVVGVELSSELVAIAQRNVAVMGRRRIRFAQGDASEFSDYDRMTHLYMYNPFPCAVMARVVDHLAASLARVPRDIAVVYRNPLCHEALMASGLFEVEAELQPDQHVWRIYRHRASGPGRKD